MMMRRRRRHEIQKSVEKESKSLRDSFGSLWYEYEKETKKKIIKENISCWMCFRSIVKKICCIEKKIALVFSA